MGLTAVNKTLAPTVTFDATGNVKQQEFLRTVLLSASGQLPYRYLFYGGAIRGGKTAVCCTASIILMQTYPKIWVHIVRESLPSLKQTVIDDFVKYIPNSIRYKHNRSENYIEFQNGSRAYFFSENFQADKDLNRFKGLQTNIFYFDQIEEIQQATFEKAIERAGSRILPNMPMPLILATFNPAFNWVKNEIYDKHRAGELEPPYYFLSALPSDNPYVTSEQQKAWENMNSINYRRFIEGDWDAMDTTGRVAYAFSHSKHVDSTIKHNKGLTTYLSFDFNVNPITCLVCQHSDKWIHVLKEYALPNSNIHELSRRIYADFPNTPFVVTGDAAGRARSALTDGNFTYISVVQKELQLAARQVRFPTHNPSVEGSAVVLNSLLERFPSFKVHPDCKELIADMMSVKWTDAGQIDKKDPKRTHLLDCLRYYVSTHWWKFVKM